MNRPSDGAKPPSLGESESTALTENRESVLRARARALAKPVDDDQNTEDSRSLICFALEEEHFAVDIAWGRAILPLQSQSWTPIPGTPPFVVGAVSVRGHIYALLDIARYLGIAHTVPEATAHIVVIDDAALGMELGLITDNVPQIVSIPTDTIGPAPSDILARAGGLALGITQDLCLILDLAKLLANPDIVVDVTV